MCENIVSFLKNSLFTKRSSIVFLILFSANLNGKGTDISEQNQSVKPTGSNVLSARNFINYSDVTRAGSNTSILQSICRRKRHLF